MRVLLDTHILLQASGGVLDERRRTIIEQEDQELFVSAVTLWEITKLVELGHLTIDSGFDRFMQDLWAHSRYTIVQYDATLMIELLRIAPKLHKDPADQIIVATARVLDARLMTNDDRIRRSKLVNVI
jgi:PIN domain nuclease of toxin-antitoxin system